MYDRENEAMEEANHARPALPAIRGTTDEAAGLEWISGRILITSTGEITILPRKVPWSQLIADRIQMMDLIPDLEHVGMVVAGLDVMDPLRGEGVVA